MVWNGIVWYMGIWYGIWDLIGLHGWCDVVWYGVVWYGRVYYGMVWYGMV